MYVCIYVCTYIDLGLRSCLRIGELNPRGLPFQAALSSRAEGLASFRVVGFFLRAFSVARAPKPCSGRLRFAYSDPFGYSPP